VEGSDVSLAEGQLDAPSEDAGSLQDTPDAQVQVQELEVEADVGTPITTDADVVAEESNLSRDEPDDLKEAAASTEDVAGLEDDGQDAGIDGPKEDEPDAPVEVAALAENGDDETVETDLAKDTKEEGQDKESEMLSEEDSAVVDAPAGESVEEVTSEDDVDKPVEVPVTVEAFFANAKAAAEAQTEEDANEVIEEEEEEEEGEPREPTETELEMARMEALFQADMKNVAAGHVFTSRAPAPVKTTSPTAAPPVQTKSESETTRGDLWKAAKKKAKKKGRKMLDI